MGRLADPTSTTASRPLSPKAIVPMSRLAPSSARADQATMQARARASTENSGDWSSWSLLANHSLLVRATGDTRALVERWIPANAQPVADPAHVHAEILVAEGAVDSAASAERRALEVSGAQGWAIPDGTRLWAPHGSSAIVDHSELRALITIASSGRRGGVDADYLLTVAASLLIGRLDRALVRAASVRAPDGRAWLVIGGTRDVKSTVRESLDRAGWESLSDDHAVVGRDTSPYIDAWPRAARPDIDLVHERSADERPFTPSTLTRVAQPEMASLAGLLFPTVDSEAPSGIWRIPPADAFAGLVRQSPWIMVDASRAWSTAGLLAAVARLPAFALRLGPDARRDAVPVNALLRAAGA
jgi:hypothetical protein